MSDTQGIDPGRPRGVIRSLIKRVGRWLWFQLEWSIYHRATIWQRMAYDQGVSRGMHCEHVRLIGPQMTQEVRFFPGVKPKRDFLTYREFKALNSPKSFQGTADG